MDFRKLFQTGENDVNNDDIMFMQYSNYFGLSAIGKGIDKSSVGITIAGCNLAGVFNPIDDTVTASITDGYIVINGRQTKCENTPSIQFACQYYAGVRKQMYIFAQVNTTYNPLGQKLFGDGSQQETWMENRIILSYSFTPTPVAGTVLIGTCYVGGTEPSPAPIIVTQSIRDIPRAVAFNAQGTDLTTTNRSGRSDEIVTVKNLHEVIGNQTIMKITSSSYSIQGNGERVFFFQCPNDTVDAMLIGASATKNANEEYGCKTGEFGSSWVYNRTTKILNCYFDIEAFEFATALIAISRV